MTYEEAKKMLGTDGITCIVLKDGAEPLISRIRGVRPVIQWIEEGADLKYAAVFDTIVGRAAGMMYALAGAGYVYGRVMSRGGAAELEKAGIAHECGESVEIIVNRQGTGMCPMEQSVAEITDPREALTALKAKIAQMQAKQ